MTGTAKTITKSNESPLLAMAAALALFTAITIIAVPAHADSADKAQEIVDDSVIALKDLTNNGTHPTVISVLKNARAVAVFPAVLKGGIGIGGEGGSGVLLTRSSEGVWSNPAFYRVGAVSLGFQLGVQETRVLIMIMTDQALEKIMNGNTSFGGDMSAVAIDEGVDTEFSTKSGRNDIYYYAETERGLYAGANLEGSDIDFKRKTTRNYYGQDVNPAQILLEFAVNNPGAENLRALLASYSAPR